MIAHHVVATPVISSAARRGLRLLLSAVGATVMLGAAACPGRSSAPARVARPALPDSAEQAMYGVSAVLNANGVARGQLRASIGYVYDDGSRLELRNVSAAIYGAEGDSVGALTAAAGTFDTRQGRLATRGGVVVAMNDGRRLTSEQVVFDVLKNQLTGTDAYTYTGPGARSGVGFESDPRLGRVRPLQQAAAPKAGAQGAAGGAGRR